MGGRGTRSVHALTLLRRRRGGGPSAWGVRPIKNYPYVRFVSVADGLPQVSRGVAAANVIVLRGYAPGMRWPLTSR